MERQTYESSSFTLPYRDAQTQPNAATVKLTVRVTN